MKNLFLIFAFSLGLYLNAQEVTFSVDAGAEGTSVSEHLIGAFFEDINYGADGGLYAELVQNRSFEYYTIENVSLEPLDAWELIEAGGADATMEVEDLNPLNQNNTNYLKFTVNNAGTEAGFRNLGFDGIVVEKDRKYDFSVYLRNEGGSPDQLEVRLESPDGTVLGRDTVKNITGEWAKYSLELPVNASENMANLVLATQSTGTFYVDMVSLFPQNTYKNRENGLRKDLAQAIEEMKPEFLRFPGGCITHGNGLDNAYRWKHTVGDVAERKPNWNLWGYHQTYGLGFYEYFLFSEDLGAEPFPVLPVGVSCHHRGMEVAPMDEMDPWVQDALDLIEFANGDETTEWGKVRAEMGHPEPFNLKYLCLGNEELDVPEFRERFTLIAEAVRDEYPEIEIIGTSGPAAGGSDYDGLWEFNRELGYVYAVDEHYYMSPQWFINNTNRYDDFDRDGPKVFIGEYASQDDRLFNAMAEAAYLTGVERNADIIEFSCYAPLFSNVNHEQWHPDLIRFNNTQVVKTPSYYVQQLYSLHAGNEYIPSQVTYEPSFFETNDAFTGKIGIGTWSTQADFDDISVTAGEKTYIDERFDSSAGNMEVLDGNFTLNSDFYSQTSSLQPAWSTHGTNIDTTNYVYSLRARKTGGNEGFLIPFGFKNEDDFYWLNIGGWGNSQHAVEKSSGGVKSTVASTGGSIETGVWYDIRIEVTPGEAKCYLNDDLLFTVPSSQGTVTASVTKDTAGDELIVKLVNTDSRPVTTNINIEGAEIDAEGKLIQLTGDDPSLRNSINNPSNIVPVKSDLTVSNSFEFNLPALSFQIFKIKINKIAQTVKEPVSEFNKENKLSMVPNPMKNETQISFPNPSDKTFSVSLYDVFGKQVLKKSGLKGDGYILENDRLKAGTYIVLLELDNRAYSDQLFVLP